LKILGPTLIILLAIPGERSFRTRSPVIFLKMLFKG